MNPTLSTSPLPLPLTRQSEVLGAIGVATAALLLGAWKGVLVAALALAVGGIVAM